MSNFKQLFNASRVSLNDLAKETGLKVHTVRMYVSLNKPSLRVQQAFDKLEKQYQDAIEISKGSHSPSGSLKSSFPQADGDSGNSDDCGMVCKIEKRKPESPSREGEILDAQIMQVLPNKNFRKVRILKTGEGLMARVGRPHWYTVRGRQCQVECKGETWWIV